MRKFAGLLFSLLIAACGTDIVTTTAIPDGERVFLAGPLRLIKEDPPPTTTTTMPDGSAEEVVFQTIQLSLLSRVEITGEKGGGYFFTRFIPYHPANTGWGPKRAFLRDSEFSTLHEWSGPSSATYCHKSADCYALTIHANATFTLSQKPLVEGECDLAYESTQCTLSGHLQMARSFIRLAGDNGYEDYFVLNRDHSLCWVDGMNFYDQCLPRNPD